ncbi:TPA: Lar family restriction alleviation protein [Stenotrophomonas maltophilia]|nr:Lar family restriction alleviation protein [Stenotrophomonas maltophilia]
MSTDKTLADVQPGGRVRLGDQAELDRLEFQAWARELLPCPFCGNSAEFVPYKDNGLTLKCKSMGCIQRNQRTLRYGIDWLRTSMAEHWNTRALSAQPSPDGQGDELPALPHPNYPISKTGLQNNLYTASQMQDYARTALAARQPAGEPVAVVVPGAPTRCRHCESTDLEWFAHVRAVNDVPHGRLTTHDVTCVFVLGCNECSETLHTVKADSIASLLAAPPVQAVNLGLQLDRYDAGLLGDGGGGDVNWWQDYLRAELDRAHEFYQDQADAHG